jgi:3-oxoacyl-[acyl-carrier protein] reductase
MTQRFDGKVAAITGGGSGIGEATAIRLAEEGARVAALDINQDGAELTAKLAGDGLGLRCDVSDSAVVDAALATVEEELGPVDIWVNCAGVGGAGGHLERVTERVDAQLEEAGRGEEITTRLDALIRLGNTEWDQMIGIHLNGTFYGTRAAARSMVQRETGTIVNISSVCGLEGCTGHPHYSAAKGAILTFTRAVAKELIVQGVRVNAIAPGFVDTPINNPMGEAALEMVRQRTPAGRFARPQEIADAVMYLCSDESSYVVGESFSVNGGFLTR